MNDTFSRRTFITILAGAGTGLVLGVRVLDAASKHPALPRTPAEGTLSAWVRIDDAGVVTIGMSKSEMGQGVHTALPMIVAEELDAEWSAVRIEQTPATAAFPTNTGGSDSVRSMWMPLRRAGATARSP